tara:strand:+ start:1739 stop:2086 length:348 start_codon:yes stop_codon:yes gene_type:complete
MKKIFLISLMVFSCNNEIKIDKPKDLIDQEMMSKILYDITIMNSIKGSGYLMKGVDSIFSREYIYTKYGIDSTIFINSQIYYSKTPKKMMSIFLRVDQRLERSKDSIEELMQKND